MRNRYHSHHPGLRHSSHLTVSPVALGVVAQPGLPATSGGLVVAVATVDTTGLLAGSGEATRLAVLSRNTGQYFIHRS